jgi:hypothetical protein
MQQKFDIIPINERDIRQMTQRIKKRIPVEAVGERQFDNNRRTTGSCKKRETQ